MMLRECAFSCSTQPPPPPVPPPLLPLVAPRPSSPYPPSLPAPPSTPVFAVPALVHALLYHGAYTRVPRDGAVTHDSNLMCTDYFQAAVNHQQMLIQPLLRQGARVLTYFHTFASGNRSRDARLVAEMRPDGHRFVPDRSTPRIVDSYIAAIDLWTSSLQHADFIHMLRFDLVLRVPIERIPISWQSVNLPWRAEEPFWRGQRTTSDLWAVFPARDATTYREALIWSGNFNAPCCHGASHWVYDALQQRLGASQIAFVQPGYYSSTQDMRTLTSVPKDNLFLGILRDCSHLNRFGQTTQTRG